MDETAAAAPTTGDGTTHGNNSKHEIMNTNDQIKEIKYQKYKNWPENPKCYDYMTFLPLNIAHYFTNLSNAFGWKFVTLVGSVYGIQQGLKPRLIVN